MFRALAALVLIITTAEVISKTRLCLAVVACWFVPYHIISYNHHPTSRRRRKQRRGTTKLPARRENTCVPPKKNCRFLSPAGKKKKKKMLMQSRWRWRHSGKHGMPRAGTRFGSAIDGLPHITTNTVWQERTEKKFSSVFNTIHLQRRCMADTPPNMVGPTNTRTFMVQHIAGRQADESHKENSIYWSVAKVAVDGADAIGPAHCPVPRTIRSL